MQLNCNMASDVVSLFVMVLHGSVSFKTLHGTHTHTHIYIYIYIEREREHVHMICNRCQGSMNFLLVVYIKQKILNIRNAYEKLYFTPA
jgi:hypothetical protein